MQTLDYDEVSLYVEAPPVCCISAVLRTSRGCPTSARKFASARWLNGATGPSVGAQFEATNRASRGPAWKNRPVVVAAEPGREFAFSRTEKFAGTIVWRYRFAPEGCGTRVTERYEVVRPISRLGWLVITHIYGSSDRRGDLRAGMQQTLERIRAKAETLSSTEPR